MRKLLSLLEQINRSRKMESRVFMEIWSQRILVSMHNDLESERAYEQVATHLAELIADNTVCKKLVTFCVFNHISISSV